MRWASVLTRTVPSCPRPGSARSPPQPRRDAAFDRVLAQVQEVSQLLLKVQSDALAVLNDAAAANAQALGGSLCRRDAKDGHRGHAERIAPGHRRHRRDAPADDRAAGGDQAGDGHRIGERGGSVGRRRGGYQERAGTSGRPQPSTTRNTSPNGSSSISPAARRCR